MGSITFYYVVVVVLVILCIIILVCSLVLISNAKKIRKDLDKIWFNSQPFQMARTYEFMGEKSKAIQCYKETLFNVLHKTYKIPKMNKKLQIDYLESKIISLGGEVPDEL